jgi:hypothetical protein
MIASVMLLVDRAGALEPIIPSFSSGQAPRTHPAFLLWLGSDPKLTGASCSSLTAWS